ALVVVVLTVVGSLGTDPARALVGVLALAVFTVVAFSGRGTALGAAIAWLVLLGFTRRLLIPFAGWSVNDPLLLFSPAAAVVLLLAMRDDRPPPRTLISSLVLFQLLWIFGSMFNPNEANLIVAAQGALYFVIPLVWVFVGRHLTTSDHDRLLELL